MLLQERHPVLVRVALDRLNARFFNQTFGACNPAMECFRDQSLDDLVAFVSVNSGRRGVPPEMYRCVFSEMAAFQCFHQSNFIHVEKYRAFVTTPRSQFNECSHFQTLQHDGAILVF